MARKTLIDLSGLRIRDVLYGLRFRPRRPSKDKVTHWFNPPTRKIEAINGKETSRRS
jgi:hypothetical protein